MKQRYRIPLFPALFFMFMPLFSEAHEASGTARVGPDMAVLAANDDDGIQLSELAIKTIKIKTAAPSELKGGVLPESSILRTRDEEAVYRVRGNWFKRLDLEGAAAGRRALTGLDLKPGDKIVIQGVPLLRASELEAFGSEEEEEEEEGHREHEHKGHADHKDGDEHDEPGEKHER